MITVAALTSGKNVPSSRFRIRQHREPLQRLGINVREYIPLISKYASIQGTSNTAKQTSSHSIFILKKGIKIATRLHGLIGSWKADITWLERELLPGYLTLEPLLKRPFVFDVDDAIWLGKPFGKSAAIHIAKRADIVIAGNAYIAEWFNHYVKKIQIVPTAIDIDRFAPKIPQDMKPARQFTIGWTGSKSNLKYLNEIEKPLYDFIKTHNAELLIISDQPPVFTHIPPDKIKFIQWSPDLEVNAVQEMDVGLMPLPSNDWTRGKCSFKMLQYMACALPVIVSPVGMNNDILSLGSVGLSADNMDDWYYGLDYLYNHPDKAYQLGSTGRMIAEIYFGKEIIAAKLAVIFKGLV